MFALLRKYLIKLHCRWLQEKFLSVALVICLDFSHTLPLSYRLAGGVFWMSFLGCGLFVFFLCVWFLSLRGGKVRSLLSHIYLSGCTSQRFSPESVFLFVNGQSRHANLLFARSVVASSSLRFGRNSEIVIQPHLPSYFDIVRDF